MLLSDNFISGTIDCTDVIPNATEVDPTLDELFTKTVNAPWIKREIRIEKAVKKATITIGCTGFYEFYINNIKLNRSYLAPYISNPDDTVFYDHYDITDNLNECCELKFLLGNGFQNPYSGYVWFFDKAIFRAAPKLAFAVEIEYCDGSVETIEADESTLTTPSNIIYDDLRLGEKYDATLTEGEWTPAIKIEPPKGEKLMNIASPIIVTDTLELKNIWQEGDAFIYDFGQNNSGVIELSVDAVEGQKITLSYCERLTDGKFDGFDISFPYVSKSYNQQDFYICHGGLNKYTPHFTYHGFRYVKVEGITSKQAKKSLLKYLVMSSITATNGSFSCSDDRINTLHQMTLRSTESNFFHIPTDCPHREKNGWTADAALSSSHTLLYYNPEDNYKQWLRCINKAQNDSGALPGIIPTGGWGFDWGNGPAWDIVLAELPWQIWQKRNDLSAFENSLPYMIKYINYLETRFDDNGLLAIGLGDWCAPHDPIKAPLLLTDSVMAYDFASKTAQMCIAASKLGEAEYCTTFAEKIKSNIRRVLFDKDNAVFEGQCQTSQAIGIFYNIIEPDETEATVNKLIEYIEQENYHFDTGVIGARVILHVLADNGHVDIAMKMLTNPTRPSYMEWIEDGETTLAECFSKSQNHYSHNHHFWGNISAFFMEQLCGIRVKNDRIDIIPHFASELESAKAEFNSVWGVVSVKWHRENNKIVFELNMPEDAKGDLLFDGQSPKEAVSGKYII